MSLPPKNHPEEREYFQHQMLTDTGFFCREVLGMDTDRDEHGNALSEIGKGGVRATGPHQEVVRFFDDPEIKYGVLLAPRYSYKSSIVQGFIMRLLCAHPNISILLLMHEQDMATQRCTQMRDALLSNPIIKELFPDMQGPTWKSTNFTTGIRTDHTLQSPSLFIGSPQKLPTGGRPNVVIFDDIVSDQNFSTEIGRQKGRKCIEHSLPLGSRGCRYYDVGTPYDPSDAHHFCMSKSGWKRLVHLDVGYDISKKEDRTLDLVGDGRWPNLSREFLMEKLRSGLSYQKFMSDYKLKVVSGFENAFERFHFQPCAWREAHQDLTGYLLNDVAPSGEQKNDLNVLMYVGVDKDQNIYLLDCELGHWQMYEFCERYIDMVERWSGKVNHRKEIWEKGQSSYSYIQHLYVEAKRRGIQPRPIYAKRSGSAVHKDSRIAGLQIRFQMKQVFVMDTMPTNWNNKTEIRCLWDPAVKLDDYSGQRMPGGDLVDHFIQWPTHPKKDVPDCLTLIDTLDSETDRRVCFWIKPSRQRLSEAVERKPTPLSGRAKGSTARFYERLGRRTQLFSRSNAAHRDG